MTIYINALNSYYPKNEFEIWHKDVLIVMKVSLKFCEVRQMIRRWQMKIVPLRRKKSCLSKGHKKK